MSQEQLFLKNQLCFSLYKASNALQRSYKSVLGELELTYPQYLVMMALWQRDQRLVKELAEETAMEPAQLSPLLKRLEGKGIIQRVRQPDDERKVAIELSDKGRQLKTSALCIPETMLEKVGMSMAEAQEFKRLAEKLSQALDKA